MGKLIITPEILALQDEWAAWEAGRQEPESLPPKIAAFWNAQEPDTPAWRLERGGEREARQEAASRGAWTG